MTGNMSSTPEQVRVLHLFFFLLILNGSSPPGLSTLLLGEQLRALHSTSLSSGVKQFYPSNLHSGEETARRDLPSTFPVIALGGTFDHLHSGHKILLSMSAWIANEKVIVGVTGLLTIGLHLFSALILTFLFPKTINYSRRNKIRIY